MFSQAFRFSDNLLAVRGHCSMMGYGICRLPVRLLPIRLLTDRNQLDSTCLILPSKEGGILRGWCLFLNVNDRYHRG